MTLFFCALCDQEITEQNASEEHIIPNSIGGRKKIRNFLCKPCNNRSGHDWDSELARQLNPLSVLLGIGRQRNKVPSQIFETTQNEQILMHSDGTTTFAQPTFSKRIDNGKVIVEFSARSVDEEKRMIKELKRKGRLELISREERQIYPSGMLKTDLTITGTKAMRSIVKSVLALVFYSGIDPRYCRQAREYLLVENTEPCFGFYYERDLVKNRLDGIPFHCVSVRGNCGTKELTGYVELFGCWRIALCLTDTYAGTDFTSCYAINPIDGTGLDLEVDISFKSEEISAAHEKSLREPHGVQMAIERIIAAAHESSREREQQRVLIEAIRHASSQLGIPEDGSLTFEHDPRKFATLVMEKLQPYLLHLMNFSGRTKEK